MKNRLFGLIALLLALFLFLTGCTAEDAELLLTLMDEMESIQTDWEEISSPDEDDHSPQSEDTESLLPTDEPEPARTDWEESASPQTLDEDGHYSSKSEVGLYLYLYGHLPGNYITKKEAQDLGWVSKEGNLWDVAPGMSIGGDRFRNNEGLLPEDKTYYECDVDFDGGYRSGERIVFSTDGYIYYTEDHYESFTQLYP